MFSSKRLEMEIKELDLVDPKYVPIDEIRKEASPIFEQITMMHHVVFLQPNDPWMVSDDNLIRLPFPPVGEGLSMEVCALPLLKALGGRLLWNPETEHWDVATIGSDEFICEASVSPDEINLVTHPEMRTMVMKLSDLLIPLKMGILLLENGSVYIGKRKQLAKLSPPDLDDQYRLILHPFSDEDLFKSDTIIDEWGNPRQRYNQVLAIRSLAFSKASYNMHITPFIMEGWLDYTLIYEGQIMAKADDWNLEPSRKKQFLSSIKQLIATQSTKAVVMGRPTSSQSAIINITFTGTKHAADWLNNFKVNVSNQLHKGFYELASQFDSMTDQIHLALLAKTLGRKSLTLTDVFDEAKKPDSCFKIWVTGHSQGGALTQVYIAEFLCKRGVLPENIFGYSFASPSVATTLYCKNPGAYPVFNINNADDFAFRVGSRLRLGVDLIFYPDENFRIENYPEYVHPDRHEMYQDILRLCYWMTDSFKFGEFMIAMASFSTRSPVAINFVEWIEETPILKQLFRMFKKKKELSQAIHDQMYKMLQKPYLDAGGAPPSEERIKQISDYLEILFNKWGIDCFTSYIIATHNIPKNYSTIVQKPYLDFKRGVWSTENPARLLTADGESLMDEIPFPDISA